LIAMLVMGLAVFALLVFMTKSLGKM
jgi:hypothetical protein